MVDGSGSLQISKFITTQLCNLRTNAYVIAF